MCGHVHTDSWYIQERLKFENGIEMSTFALGIYLYQEHSWTIQGRNVNCVCLRPVYYTAGIYK